MSRIIGLVFSGFMVRLYGLGIALWIALTAYGIVTESFGRVSAEFERIQTATR